MTCGIRCYYSVLKSVVGYNPSYITELAVFILSYVFDNTVVLEQISESRLTYTIQFLQMINSKRICILRLFRQVMPGSLVGHVILSNQSLSYT